MTELNLKKGQHWYVKLPDNFVLNECDIIGIGQRGSGRLAMSGIQRASNLPGAGLMGRAFGKILSLHDFVAERRMFTADIKGDSLKGVTSARVLAVDYHAHGYVASTHVKSFVATLVRVEGYVDSATADPVSVVTVIPRNQSVLTHGTHTPDNPLEHAIHMLEIVSERPGV